MTRADSLVEVIQVTMRNRRIICDPWAAQHFAEKVMQAKPRDTQEAIDLLMVAFKQAGIADKPVK